MQVSRSVIECAKTCTLEFILINTKLHAKTEKCLKLVVVVVVVFVVVCILHS